MATDPTKTAAKLPAEDLQALAVLLLMITQHQAPGADPSSQSWVRRRTDRIELLDEQSVRFCSDFEFEVPDEVWGLPTTDIPFVPLTTFRRGTRLRAVELHDHEGTRIPLATPDECGDVAVRGVHAFAKVLLADYNKRNPGSPHSIALDDTVEANLRSVVIDDHGAKAARKLFEDAAKGTSAPADERAFQRWLAMTYRAETGDANLSTVIADLAANFAVAAVLSKQELRRRTLSLRWTQPIARDVSFWTWLSLRMAWTELKVSLPVPATRTRNYLVELPAPSDDLLILWAGLARAKRGGSTYLETDDARPAQLRFTMRSLEPGSAVPVMRVHYSVRPTRSRVLAVAWFTTALCAVVLNIAGERSSAITLNAEGGAAFLLFLPGLLSLYLVRPAEHPLALQFFSGVRLVAIFAALCGLAAGGLVILDPDPGWREYWWTALRLLSVAALLAVTASMLGLARARPHVDTEAPDPREARAKRPVRHPAAIAALIGALIGAVTLGACVLIVGASTLGIERRFEAAIDAAQRSADANRDAPLSLASFARVPWKRMYIFKARTSRGAMAKAIGRVRIAAGERRDHNLPDKVPAGDSLIVLVDGAAIARVFAIPETKAHFDSAAYPKQCFLSPTGVLRVSDDARVSVKEPDDDCA